MSGHASNLVIARVPTIQSLGQTNLIFWVTDFFFADVTRQGGGEKIIIIPQQISRLTFDPYFIDFFKKCTILSLSNKDKAVIQYGDVS